MATGTITKEIIVRKSNNISVAVASGGKGTVNTSYPTSAPSGFNLVARNFMRTDDGGWGIIIYCALNSNYIAYESTGSAPTLTGYVIDVFVKY